MVASDERVPCRNPHFQDVALEAKVVAAENDAAADVVAASAAADVDVVAAAFADVAASAVVVAAFAADVVHRTSSLLLQSSAIKIIFLISV